ncbi:aminoacyl-tRNA hydrolase [Candidatus Saccharibacteria bacterium]|nr:MAG: aminoacyl-tRNA hydrolase [Candidatus Saccharibacteria bacterium]
MALFHKKPVTTSPPIYTLGLQRVVMIVGLGNIGKQYDGTRHNIGFAVVDALAEKQSFEPWIHKKDLHADITSHLMGDTRVVLVKPTTYMNNSGQAVQAVGRFYKISNANTVVVYDDLDIPFGQIRLRSGGGSAGHNGQKSLIQHIGDDFGRVRIGIGPKQPEQMDTADFVLTTFTREQQADMPLLLQESQAILTEYIYGQTLPSETRSFIL